MELWFFLVILVLMLGGLFLLWVALDQTRTQYQINELYSLIGDLEDEVFSRRGESHGGYERHAQV